MNKYEEALEIQNRTVVTAGYLAESDKFKHKYGISPMQALKELVDKSVAKRLDDEVKECKLINYGNCSNCGYWIDNNYCECSNDYMFCPMCGAKIVDDLEDN